jgi:hypothetical protein
MNRHHNKLTRREQEEQQASTGELSSQKQQVAVEFKTAEEALRHDRGRTTVPAAVAERLSKSIEELPKPPRSWWQFWSID